MSLAGFYTEVEPLLDYCCKLKARNEALGLWKFNNSLLDDEVFVNLITKSYPPDICKKNMLI